MKAEKFNNATRKHSIRGRTSSLLSGLWYLEEKETKQQQSQRTRDETEANRLLQAKNEAHRQPAINIQIARAYLTASDPTLVSRTWQEVMEALAGLKRGTNQQRWSFRGSESNCSRPVCFVI